MDRFDETARKLFPCNCQPFEDGSHHHDCQSQYAADVAAALRAERVAGLREAWNIIEELPDQSMVSIYRAVYSRIDALESPDAPNPAHGGFERARGVLSAEWDKQEQTTHKVKEK